MNYDILLAPVVTEKSQALAAKNVFVFKVDRKSNKTQIKQVVEKKFGVKVESVNTMNVITKKKKVGKYAGRTNAYKKAYVKLTEGSKLEF